MEWSVGKCMRTNIRLVRSSEAKGHVTSEPAGGAKSNSCFWSSQYYRNSSTLR